MSNLPEAGNLLISDIRLKFIQFVIDHMLLPPEDICKLYAGLESFEVLREMYNYLPSNQASIAISSWKAHISRKISKLAQLAIQNGYLVDKDNNVHFVPKDLLRVLDVCEGDTL